jgi:membrane protease YdiL (CAAX protease family)
MAAGMVYIRTQGIRYGDVAMLDGFWPILIGLNVMTLWVAARYFGWRAVGLGMFRPRPLLWLLPFLAVLTVKWAACVSALAANPPDAQAWRILAFIGFTTFLVGLGEETMFRGILLHAFLRRGTVLRAMLVSTVGFSLLHSVSVLAEHSGVGMLLQLVYTFLWGFMFAPLALRLNSLWPLIVVHWLWNFAQFTGHFLQEPSIAEYDYLHYPIELVVGAWLWIAIWRCQRTGLPAR